jgi:hypothetical protein
VTCSSDDQLIASQISQLTERIAQTIAQANAKGEIQTTMADNVRLETKTCAVCGRVMQWRKAWAKNWGEVKYCSDSCRKKRNAKTSEPLETAILSLLALRADDASICPSEAARLVGGDDWQELMEPARSAARRLQDRGEVLITQKGKPIDPSTAKGPIRIRKAG